jgi:ribokinase
VVVVGSANVDLVAYCDRFPDDGESLVGRTFTQGFGGKGANQAVMAARLGSQVTFVGCVGADSLGAEITANLAAEGIDVSEVVTAEGVSTGVAPIWVDGAGTNRILIVPGANHAFGPPHVTEALDRLGAAAVVVGQLETRQDATAAAFAWARRVGATTILNPAPAADLTPELLARTDWLVPNELEFAALAGGVPTAETVAACAGRWGCDVLVTMGDAGALVGARGTAAVSVPAPVVRAVDSTGAGDAFVGAFAHAIGLGNGPPEAARLGCACGALSVTRPGAQQSFPDRAAVEALLATLESGLDQKVRMRRG